MQNPTIVKLIKTRTTGMAAKQGAMALVLGSSRDFFNVVWLTDKLSGDQINGRYFKWRFKEANLSEEALYTIKINLFARGLI